MKILVGATNFYPHIGWIESYTLRLFSSLHKRYGHAIDIVTLNNCCAEEEDFYCWLGIYRLPCSSFPTVNPLFSPIKLFCFLKKRKYDLIISQGRFYYMSLFLVLRCKITHTKHIHIEHNAWFMVHESIFIEYIAKLYDKTLGRLVLLLSKYIVAISNTVVKFIVDDLHINKNVSLLYNGIDIAQFPFIYTYQQQQRILFYGRVTESKWIFIAIDALKDLTEYTLEVVGWGEDLAKAKAYCQLHHITNVEFLWPQQPSYIIENINKYAMFVFPSFFSEGLPTTLLELGALGLPIIATDVGWIVEIITHNEDGIIIPQKDSKKLYEVIKEFHYNHSHTVNLRKKIESTFAINHIADKWEAFLISL